VFKEQVEAAQVLNPTLINCHALKDCFTEEMAAEFFTEVLAWQDKNNYRSGYHTNLTCKKFKTQGAPRDTQEAVPSLSMGSKIICS